MFFRQFAPKQSQFRSAILPWLCFVSFLPAYEKVPVRILLVGDSVTNHYSPHLGGYLSSVPLKGTRGPSSDSADVALTTLFGGDSKRLLSVIRSKFSGAEPLPDILLINCGLHDIRRKATGPDYQVYSENYRDNLSEILKLVSATDTKVIWIRTTPVVDSIHNNNSVRDVKRFASDVSLYNHIADSLCLANGVPVIDLYHFTKSLGADAYSDHVHYKRFACALQAGYVAGYLQNFLNTKR